MVAVWDVSHLKSDDRLRVLLHEVHHDTEHELGVDPGLVKDGVEAHLQALLAEHISTLGEGFSLVRREYMTAIGPVDLLAKDAAGVSVAVEIKRRGDNGDHWLVVNPKGEQLTITLLEVVHDTAHEFGDDPGLQKDGVEAHLQELLAASPQAIEDGLTLVRREYPTAIGPVDLMCRDAGGLHVAVEIKRRGEIDGVEQLTRYLDLLNRDPHLAPVTGVFAAQEIKPQARTLAEDRGIRCVTLDYAALRGLDDTAGRLF